MAKILKENRFWIILIIVTAAAAASFSIYKSRSTQLLDKDAFRDFREAVKEVGESEAGGFTSQDELRSFITGWADEHSLEYIVDEAGSIIFDREAAGRKKNDAPTLVCVSMNYETAISDASLLASAASIALSDIESGRRTVIFADYEQAHAGGYKSISKDYIGSKTKVIYIDKGSSSYLSTSSYLLKYSEAVVPAEKEESTLDTAVHVKISGIKSNEVGPGIGSQPDPISAFSTLLTRLKSKSVTCRLADVSVGSNGNMYPTSIEATITMNSYSAGSFTAYIEKRIKAWEKAYSKDHENLEYSYEVISDPEKMPAAVYTAETTDRLTGVLYTIKTGTYKYASNDPVPDDKSVGETCGINCMLDLTASDNEIRVKLMSQGYDDMFTNRMIYDNKAACELYECTYEQTKEVKAFLNEKDSLKRNFEKTYYKVNDTSSSSSQLDFTSDNYFTPCSYLQKLNRKADIVHLRINSSNASMMANTVLCYIKTKGNTSFF